MDPNSVALFIPPGLAKFKLALFERIGQKIGRVVRHDYALLDQIPEDIIPITGCSTPLCDFYRKWKASGRNFIYWDRGYLRRVFATWLPPGERGGYYRWHLNSFQMAKVYDVPDDRWRKLNLESHVWPRRKGGSKIIIADTLPDYWQVRGMPTDWSHIVARKLKKYTDRVIIVRDKESKKPLYDELKDAHCLIAHGSIAAVEAVVMGTPVFVADESAALPVGNLLQIEKGVEDPFFPDDDLRRRWLHSLAYSQFNEDELLDGTLWRLIDGLR